MNDVVAQRRFQFSLRKLLLWIAVLAVYLGVLRLMNADLTVALITICWVTVIVAVRTKWGARRALVVAIFGTGFCLSVVFAGTVWIVERQYRPALSPLGAMIAGMPVGLLVGAFIGLCGSVVAELSIRLVGFLDGLMQTKTPHDDNGENNS
jgi:hypothetical protein